MTTAASVSNRSSSRGASSRTSGAISWWRRRTAARSSARARDASSAACGDFVEVRLTGSAQGSIERVGTRRNILYRSDQWKEKTLAANVDQAIILLAPRPAYSEAFLNLSLVACEAAGIPAIIVLNKSDLPEHAPALATLEPWSKVGYSVMSDVSPGSTRRRSFPSSRARSRCWWARAAWASRRP